MERELKHKHLLIRAEVQNPPKNEEETISWMKKLIKTIDMNILAGPYSSQVSKKGNKGLSGVAIIDTSHISIHTWDEKEPALIQLDVYSCKDFKKSNVIDCLDDFKPVTVEYKYFDRETNFIEVK